MKKIIFKAFIALATGLTAQNIKTVTFEDLNLLADTFDNGKKYANKNFYFVSDNLIFNNKYDTFFDYWSAGFAISSVTDTSVKNFSNLYSVISAKGNNNSKTYAVAQPNGIIKQHAFLTGGGNSGIKIYSLYINNTTYAYHSMLNGDFFAKKFGGTSGNDKDFFLLQLIGYKTVLLDTVKTVVGDTVDFYLADYRFDDNSKDYIINNWTKVDLSSLGRIDSLGFLLTSSDTGQFGMNTPAFFCIDDIEVEYDMTGSIKKLSSENIKVYPNPVKDILHVKSDTKIFEIIISDLSGKILLNQKNGNKIDTNALPNGIYMLTILTHDGNSQHKFIKTN